MLSPSIASAGQTEPAAPQAAPGDALLVIEQESEGPFRSTDVLTHETSATQLYLIASSPRAANDLFIRMPVGQTFAPGTYSTSTEGSDSDTAEVSSTGCSAQAPGVLVIDSVVVEGDHLTAYSLRYFIPCPNQAVHGRAVFGVAALENDHDIDKYTVNFDYPLLAGIEPPTQRVVVTNTGSSPLMVAAQVGDTRIRASSECDGREVPPGERCGIDITLRISEPGQVINSYVEIRDDTSAQLPRGQRIRVSSIEAQDPGVFNERITRISPGRILLRGDFDGDGLDHDLIAWGPRTGNDDTLLETTRSGRFRSRALSLPWATGYWAIIGNFDSDGASEVVFYGEGTLPDAIWSWNGTPTGARRAVRLRGASTPVVGDFDGNGVSDLLFYSRGTSKHDVLLFNPNGKFVRRTWSIAPWYDDIITARLDSDDTTDLIFWRQNAEHHPTWKFVSSVAHRRGSIAAAKGAIPIPIDVDHSVVASDLLWFRPGSTRHRVALARRNWSSGPLIIAPRNAIPVVGNFDGDNNEYTDIAWWPYPGAATLQRGTDRDFGRPKSLTSNYNLRRRQAIAGVFHDRRTGDHDDLAIYAPGDPDEYIIRYENLVLLRGVDYDFRSTSPGSRVWRAGNAEAFGSLSVETMVAQRP